MFTKKKIEVIAATEAEDKPKVRSVAKPRQAAEQTEQIQPVLQPVRAGVPQAYRKTAELLGDKKPADKSSSSIQQEEALNAKVEQTGMLSDQGSETVVPESALPPLEKREILVERNTGTGMDANSLLIDEIRQMKSMVSKLTSQQEGARELPETLQQITERMSRQGIMPELAERWLAPVVERWESSEGQMTHAELVAGVEEQIDQFLLDKIGSGISPKTKIAYIAGPTGVGKTTTIAKLAADQIFKAGKKVGLITADTYRISAVEQLRTYASILNVPLEVVQSPGDMQRAMARLEDCDLVLMDTAGRNYLNELHVAELHSLLSLSEQSETYLVLSLTSKMEDMRKITDHFGKYGLDKVIFTKLDETESCGPLFNLVADYPLLLSYITNGQNVPDDLLSVNRELLFQELLGDLGAPLS